MIDSLSPPELLGSTAEGSRHVIQKLLITRFWIIVHYVKTDKVHVYSTSTYYLISNVYYFCLAATYIDSLVPIHPFYLISLVKCLGLNKGNCNVTLKAC